MRYERCDDRRGGASATPFATPSEPPNFIMLLLLSAASLTAPAADRVQSLPGFNNISGLPFKIYSGYLTVPGPFSLTDYDSLSIHYQLQTVQGGAADAPVATWHQGGPGGSSIDVGLYTEMGALQISDQGTYINEFAWNKVANMLYLESPAGSGQSSGYSTCIKGGIQVPCKWDDVSQAEAYAHSLLAFYKAFPEYAKNDLFLTGESYFGQYGPNIAHWILTHAPFNSTIPLKGIAAGNACWGGDDTHVQCNGPNEELNDLELFHGKGLISNKIYKATKAACQFGVATTESASCSEMLSLVHEAVGPHNIYNLYDNCPGFDLAEAEGMDARELKQKLRLRMLPGGGVEEEQEATPTAATAAREDGKDQAVTSRAAAAAAVASPDRVEAAVAKTGGYAWSCGGMGATSKWITSPAVRKALHLKDKAGSRFGYSWSGPASITLWPFLAQHLRVLCRHNADRTPACLPACLPA
jgi:hypothetical protein